MLQRRKYLIGLAIIILPWFQPGVVEAQPLINKSEPTIQEIIFNEDGSVLVEGNALVANLSNAESVHQKWKQEQKTKVRKITYPKLSAPTNYNPCSCVSYARWRSGINVGSIGSARNHPVNAKTPTVGGLMVTYESKLGHLSYVVGKDENFAYVDEANYVTCKVTFGRAIPLNSPLIKGYYN